MLTDELKQLFDRNLQANLQLLNRAGGVLRGAGQAARDPQRLRGTDARALVADLLKLQLDFYARLSEQSVQYLNAVVSLAESAVADRPAPPATAATATVLAGAVGDTLTFQFQLDNPNDRAVSAAIESREWLGRDGQRVAADSLQFDPAAALIEAKGSRVVQGRLAIDERFAAGATYDTVIRVAGFPGREVALTLAVKSAG
jgi:hypothetical protein